MEAFETFEHAGMMCELHTDEDPMAPSDWDQLGELVALPALWDHYRFAARETTRTEDDALDRGEGDMRLLARYLRVTSGAVIVPFHFQDYGSSGARLFAGDLTDDGAAGFIMATPERCAVLGVDIADAEKQLRGELDEWATWVAGEVVGFVVKDSSGDWVASCWGFYPDKSTSADPLGLEYVRGEARYAAEHERDERTRAANQDVATR
jgi:hypothetical protein